MKTKQFVKGIVALAALCGLAQATTFTWDNALGGGNQLWDDCENWSYTCFNLRQFPNSCSDDAIFPDGGDPDDEWRVRLVPNSSAQGINSITIEEDIEFVSVAGSPIMVTESLTIYGDGEEVRLKIRETNTQLSTANCP